MQVGKHPFQHDSRIARLQQTMTALAEAQVRTKESAKILNSAMADLALSQRDAQIQWRVFLETLPRN